MGGLFLDRGNQVLNRPSKDNSDHHRAALRAPLLAASRLRPCIAVVILACWTVSRAVLSLLAKALLCARIQAIPMALDADLVGNDRGFLKPISSARETLVLFQAKRIDSPWKGENVHGQCYA
jgi:hypothetical protein